jgi:BrnA antitoxin of type II toxin-antitoxin system
MILVKLNEGRLFPSQVKHASPSIIYIDDDVLETFRERSESAGKGYQTMMNEALRQYLEKVKQPLDEETLRRVIQEELQGLRATK